MKALLALLCVATVSTGCVEGYEEIREGKTAKIYLAGTDSDWPSVLIEDVEKAVGDWNTNVSDCYGRAPFELVGIVEDDLTFEDGDIGDGRHSIYRVTKETATDATRELKEDDPNAAAIFVGNDDIVVFSTLSNEYLDNWALWPTIIHELGHAAALGHVDEDSPIKSVMKPKRHAGSVQLYDKERFCSINGR